MGPTTSSTTYKVAGMSCGHCEGAVTAALAAVPGVTEVTADAAGGLVTVVARGPLAEEAVRTAVTEAGYDLIGRA